MARVTVEDCVQKVPNRFELVLLAAQRARNLSRGEELSVDRDNDKNPVVALREIAEETIDLNRIEQDLVKSLSRAPEPEPADEEVLDLIPTDQNIFGLQDISAEEEAAGLPVENEEMSPEDMEAAIEAELGGRRQVARHAQGGRGRPYDAPGGVPQLRARRGYPGCGCPGVPVAQGVGAAAPPPPALRHLSPLAEKVVSTTRRPIQA